MKKRCVIIPAFGPEHIEGLINISPLDFVVCADGGLELARKYGIAPDMVVGDFDSLKEIEAIEAQGPDKALKIKKVPVEKNETDSYLCYEEGIRAGCDEFVLLGGIGGRLDHTIAHLQLMAGTIARGYDFWMIDHRNRATMMLPGEKQIQKINGFKLSVLAYSEKCEGVTLRNVKYELSNATLSNSFSLGISNEFLDEGRKARISLCKGILLLLLCRD